ncbi:MAG: hypothetical protein Q9P14_06745 [candidate division KSB1 bacterium]|nr:hypothetical protein [candidate division KSB1 bacterium]MDQ7064769.1 hypothetical protein [candidate division KSB1 bacterium]
MNRNEIVNELANLMPRVRTDEPLAPYTTIGVGGPADVFVEASTVEQIRQAVAFCEAASVPYFLGIIGFFMGTGLIFRDGIGQRF